MWLWQLWYLFYELIWCYSHLGCYFHIRCPYSESTVQHRDFLPSLIVKISRNIAISEIRHKSSITHTPEELNLVCYPSYTYMLICQANWQSSKRTVTTNSMGSFSLPIGKASRSTYSRSSKVKVQNHNGARDGADRVKGETVISVHNGIHRKGSGIFVVAIARL